MSNRYWKVTGETKAKIVDVLDKVDVCLKRAAKYAKTLGAKTAYSWANYFGLDIVFTFENPPSPSVWKQDKQGYYSPKKSSKDGKEIADRIRQIRKTCPCRSMIGKAMMNGEEYGGMMDSPGVTRVGDDVYVSTRIIYNPPKPLEHEIVRVSDLEFEKAKKDAKAKSKRAKGGAAVPLEDPCLWRS